MGIMAWKYDIGKPATMLRSAIYQSDEDADGCLAVLNALRECYAKVKELIPAEDWEDYGFGEMQDEMEIIRTGIDFGDEEDLENCVENTDYALSVFYDLCDSCGIWVTL
jgi:hypothetical protein